MEAEDKYRLPENPWVIQVRWKTSGLSPPGPSSNHSSAIDVNRQLNSPPKNGSPGQMKSKHTDFVYVHMDIQLYEMDSACYLVDFKCAGYENAEGLLLEDKEITSPFPFLDLASELIIKLAETE